MSGDNRFGPRLMMPPWSAAPDAGARCPLATETFRFLTIAWTVNLTDSVVGGQIPTFYLASSALITSIFMLV